MPSIKFLLIYFITNACAIDLYDPSVISAGPTYGSYKFNVLQHLSGIAPYFESQSDQLSPDPPRDCIVSKAVYQIRHGAIYANEFDYMSTIEPFLQRLKNSFEYVNFSNSMDLIFLTRWTSPISNSQEQVAQVSKLGFNEAFNLGTRLAYRYPHLMPMKKDKFFKVWASDSNRTRRSGDAIFAGLFSGHETIGQVVSVSEDKSQGANTLAPTKTCPKFDVTKGTPQANTWLNHYSIPIIARLNAEATGFNFSANDILAMQELCGYETIIRGSSPFCGIFTPEEWLAFEYYFDIKYYYELGYGNDLSSTLGMPWVIAASDLLSSSIVKNQHLFISVAHRQIPPLIVTALGLFNDSEYLGLSKANSLLPLDQINYQRVWKTSSFISFLSHIALERLDCKSAAYSGTFVRVLVNSTPKSLSGCSSGPGGSCPIKNYKDYIKRQYDLCQDYSKACGLNDKTSADELTFFIKDKNT